MIKVKSLLLKTIQGNGTLRVKVRVMFKFLLFHSELVPTDPCVTCSVTLLERKIYEVTMSDEYPSDM